MQKINKNLNISNWKYFKLGTLFKIKSTKGNNTNNLRGGGRRCVYSRKKESNGYEFMWSLNDNKEYINCIFLYNLSKEAQATRCIKDMILSE